MKIYAVCLAVYSLKGEGQEIEFKKCDKNYNSGSKKEP
jgi:hypothetical protein